MYDILEQDFEYKGYEIKQLSTYNEINKCIMELGSNQSAASEKDFEIRLGKTFEEIKQLKTKMDNMFSNSSNAQILYPRYSEKIKSELSKFDHQQKMMLY